MIGSQASRTDTGINTLQACGTFNVNFIKQHLYIDTSLVTLLLIPRTTLFRETVKQCTTHETNVTPPPGRREQRSHYRVYLQKVSLDYKYAVRSRYRVVARTSKTESTHCYSFTDRLESSLTLVSHSHTRNSSWCNAHGQSFARSDAGLCVCFANEF